MTVTGTAYSDPATGPPAVEAGVVVVEPDVVPVLVPVVVPVVEDVVDEELEVVDVVPEAGTVPEVAGSAGAIAPTVIDWRPTWLAAARARSCVVNWAIP